MSVQCLEPTKRLFQLYKQQAEKAMAQIPDADLAWQPNEESNSVITIVKHLWGNMLSRWTDFMTTDGEKPWRKRDAEFENEVLDRATMMRLWEEGWACVFNALNGITDDDLGTIIYIRNEGQTLLDAILRQIAHYSSHIGQIIYIAKIRSNQWHTLTIPRNRSNEYNQAMFDKEREVKPFTDSLLEKKQG